MTDLAQAILEVDKLESFSKAAEGVINKANLPKGEALKNGLKPLETAVETFKSLYSALKGDLLLKATDLVELPAKTALSQFNEAKKTAEGALQAKIDEALRVLEKFQKDIFENWPKPVTPQNEIANVTTLMEEINAEVDKASTLADDAKNAAKKAVDALGSLHFWLSQATTDSNEGATETTTVRASPNPPND